jgi:hypothetical protein
MLNYRTNCVNTPPGDVPELRRMIDRAIDVTRRTFLQHVNREQLAELESQLGYERHASRGLTMASDWHVSYHRSKWRGQTCYYFRHSAIEFYFTR